MGIDWWILGFCGVVWLAHVVAIARFRRKSLASYAIAGLGIGATAVAAVFAADYAAVVGAASVGLLVFAPAVLLRRASVALRFGKPARARALARTAAVLRPLSEVRRVPRLFGLAERLAQGESVDIPTEATRLGGESSLDRRLFELALLSWTTDYRRFADKLDDAQLRALALRTGLAGAATVAVGEASDDGALLRHYERLKRSPLMVRPTFEGTSALVSAASYLGAAEVLEREARWLRHELPPARLAFAIATAQQRAGRPADAARTLDEAARRSHAYDADRRILEHRRHAILWPAPDDADFAAARADVSLRLRTRQVLSALGFDRRAPAPLTRTLALIILAAFSFQLTQPMEAVFDAWGLIRPFSEAPDPVRLISYALLHVDGWHLGVNLAGLLLFGRFAEHVLGRFWTALAFVGGAVGGGAAFLLFSTRELGIAVGASGAVLALFGVAMARLALDREVRRTRPGRIELVFLAVLAALQLTLDAFWEISAGSAHAGGLLVGLLVGALATWRGGDAARRRRST